MYGHRRPGWIRPAFGRRSEPAGESYHRSVHLRRAGVRPSAVRGSRGAGRDRSVGDGKRGPSGVEERKLAIAGRGIGADGTGVPASVAGVPRVGGRCTRVGGWPDRNIRAGL